jgi:hypothetical protein
MLRHNDIDIQGIADVVSSDSIVELKFTKEYSTDHAI